MTYFKAIYYPILLLLSFCFFCIESTTAEELATKEVFQKIEKEVRYISHTESEDESFLHELVQLYVGMVEVEKNEELSVTQSLFLNDRLPNNFFSTATSERISKLAAVIEQDIFLQKSSGRGLQTKYNVDISRKLIETIDLFQSQKALIAFVKSFLLDLFPGTRDQYEDGWISIVYGHLFHVALDSNWQQLLEFLLDHNYRLQALKNDEADRVDTFTVKGVNIAQELSRIKRTAKTNEDLEDLEKIYILLASHHGIEAFDGLYFHFRMKIQILANEGNSSVTPPLALYHRIDPALFRNEKFEELNKKVRLKQRQLFAKYLKNHGVAPENLKFYVAFEAERSTYSVNALLKKSPFGKVHFLIYEEKPTTDSKKDEKFAISKTRGMVEELREQKSKVSSGPVKLIFDRQWTKVDLKKRTKETGNTK